MKALLLSAYDAPSHRRWRKGLVRFLGHIEWVTVVLPPRHFNWRVRGNSLTWSRDSRLLDHYDLLVTTSMTDLSALRGFVPSLARVPTVVYFHENQFAYPANAGPATVEPAVLNLYTALCADAIVFNSRYNHETFFAGVEDFLSRMPDYVPSGLVAQLRQRAVVLPVPLEPDCFQSAARRDPFTLVWNHRWEYDKGPQRLLDICRGLISRRVDFRLHLLGIQFRSQPEVFKTLVDYLRKHQALGQLGYLQELSDYRQLIASSHVVLTTALHEFQGLSVQEAVASGCIPVVPDRLAYPEWFGPEYRYASAAPLTDGPEYDQEIRAAVALIADMKDQPPPLPDLSGLCWTRLALHYRHLLEAVVAQQPLTDFD